jgi:hypothetical protein
MDEPLGKFGAAIQDGDIRPTSHERAGDLSAQRAGASRDHESTPGKIV